MIFSTMSEANLVFSSQFIICLGFCLIVGSTKSSFSSFGNVSEHIISKRYANDQTCGQRENSLSLVVGGESFTRGEWPYTVAIFYVESRGPQFICGGTIISRTALLTGNNSKALLELLTFVSTYL